MKPLTLFCLVISLAALVAALRPRRSNRIAALPLLALCHKWRYLADISGEYKAKRAYASAANDLEEWIKTGFLMLESSPDPIVVAQRWTEQLHQSGSEPA